MADIETSEKDTGIVYGCRSPVLNTPAPTGKDLIVFVVEDSGIGISKEDRSRLFCPFEQIRAGASQKGNGTGLGLSICKNIITRLQGSIGCATVEHRGSKFWFAVPINPKPDATAQLAKQPMGSTLPQLQIQQAKEPLEGHEGESAQGEGESHEGLSGTSDPASDASFSSPEQQQQYTAASICEAREKVVCSALQDQAHIPASTSPHHCFHSDIGGDSTSEIHTPCTTTRDMREEAMERMGAHSKASTATGFSPRDNHTINTSSGSSCRAHSISPHAISVRSACSDAVPSDLLTSIPPHEEEEGGQALGQGEGLQYVQEPRAQETMQPHAVDLAAPSSDKTRVSATNTQRQAGIQRPLRLPRQVVVVDDTDSNRLLLSRLCQKLGASLVLSAANGHEALQLPAYLDTDVWFVDRNMPGMDGMQLCAVLRHQGCIAPIIGVTGDALDEDQVAFMAAGASMVLPKPCTRATVSQALMKMGYGTL
jgi:CheY-like chemotaxis protein